MMKIKLLVRSLIICFQDWWHQLLYTNGVISNNSQEELLSKMVVEYHTIEKGLTMPSPKLGFGVKKIEGLLDLCQKYVGKGYNTSEQRFVETIGVLKAYTEFHKSAKADPLIGGILLAIKQLEVLFPEIKPLLQIKTDKAAYFSQVEADFKAFSSSRHSIRNYVADVSKIALNEAIALAANAPSTCNRQSTRIHIIQNPDLIDFLLKIQSGNRGFGHLAKTFLILTSDLTDWPGLHQRHAPYVDGGIFLMNLLYALHYYKIAACTLNLYLPPSKEKRLKKQLAIPQNEVLIALIAVGEPPNEFRRCVSSRRMGEDITSTHE